MTEKYIYECTSCGKKYPGKGVMYLCPECASANVADRPPKGVLKVIYDYEKIRKSSSLKENLFKKIEEEKFLPLLPLKSLNKWPKLKIGNTPVYHYNKIEDQELNFDLFLKDDSQNPTFSFKDRASALVSAWAAENGIDTIIAASTGNAGSSLAGICAAQNQKSYIFVPANAPSAKLTQMFMYGAQIIPVEGNYDQAFDLSMEATKMFGFYNRNTAFNPLTIEGKKTVAFEIFRYFSDSDSDSVTDGSRTDGSRTDGSRTDGSRTDGSRTDGSRTDGSRTDGSRTDGSRTDGSRTDGLTRQFISPRFLPDRIFVPVGDGVIISGVYKGFEDLLKLGIIDKMPVIVAVQAEGSSNLVDNLGKKDFHVKTSRTLADSISVDIPRNFYMASSFIRNYNGEKIKVSDEEIIQASVLLSTLQRYFCRTRCGGGFCRIAEIPGKGPDTSRDKKPGITYRERTERFKSRPKHGSNTALN